MRGRWLCTPSGAIDRKSSKEWGNFLLVSPPIYAPEKILMAESRRFNVMELLLIEILFDIVRCLNSTETKTLSFVSKRMRDVCLPTLFRKVSIKFSTKGFDLLESLLKSSLYRYIIFF